jgi:hypothetical protein
MMSILYSTPGSYEDDHEQQKRMSEVDGFNQEETYDAYVLAQVQLPTGDDMAIGTTKT